jgi:hypothetical protein
VPSEDAQPDAWPLVMLAVIDPVVRSIPPSDAMIATVDLASGHAAGRLVAGAADGKVAAAGAALEDELHPAAKATAAAARRMAGTRVMPHWTRRAAGELAVLT